MIAVVEALAFGAACAFVGVVGCAVVVLALAAVGADTELDKESEP